MTPRERAAANLIAVITTAPDENPMDYWRAVERDIDSFLDVYRAEVRREALEEAAGMQVQPSQPGWYKSKSSQVAFADGVEDYRAAIRALLDKEPTP